MDNVIEGNKLIAAFMGWKVAGVSRNGLFGKKEEFYSFTGKRTFWLPMPFIAAFKYHEDWEWLMPVVTKIENLSDQAFFSIGKSHIELGYGDNWQPNGHWLKYDYNYFLGVDGDKLEKAWLACVDAINFYNKQKRTDNVSNERRNN